MRIRTRLLLSLGVVVLTGTASTFFLVRASLETGFRSFVFSGDLEKAKVYASILGAYHAQRGGWSGVQEFLSGLPRAASRTFDGRIYGPGPEAPGPIGTSETLRLLMSERVAVADSRGVIVADTSGTLLGTVHPAHHLMTGVEVVAAERRVGTVLVGSMVDSSLTDSGVRYLRAITGSLVFASLLSGAVAFALGMAFITRMTRPIGALTRAVQVVAGGDLTASVPVSGNDELALLSSSFNTMTGELRRLESARKQSVADSAHELRTPVNLIQGTIEAMLDGVFPADAATLESVHEETVRLARLIDELRELEVIDAGRLEIRREPVDLVELARKDLLLFSTLAQDKSITLAFEEPAGAVPPVSADPTRVQQILFNLITNALRYAPEGGAVSLSIERVDGWVAVRVDDSGPGIPAAEREKVFERFYRTDTSRAAHRGGSGLGLSIANELAKAHSGSIRITESKLGGASFVLTLPMDER